MPLFTSSKCPLLLCTCAVQRTELTRFSHGRPSSISISTYGGSLALLCRSGRSMWNGDSLHSNSNQGTRHKSNPQIDVYQVSGKYHSFFRNRRTLSATRDQWEVVIGRTTRTPRLALFLLLRRGWELQCSSMDISRLSLILISQFIAVLRVICRFVSPWLVGSHSRALQSLIPGLVDLWSSWRTNRNNLFD